MSDFTAVLDGRVPEILARHGVPGTAVGIMSGDETTLLGYGVTNVAHSLPVDPDTIFQVGSISKTLLGFVIGRLIDRGQVELDHPVAPLFPAGTGIDQRITLRHLITHTSGIDAQNMIADAPRLLADHADDSIQASLPHFVRRPLLFAPGTDYSYSGPGIMLAAAVVERVTGRHYADVLQDEVLDPAGMSGTFTTADQVVTRRVAAPHGRDRQGRPTLLVDQGWQRHWQLPGWDVPGGGVLSTVRDLMRYATQVTSAEAPGGLFQVQAHRSAGRDIGLAWMLEQVAGRPAMLHDGLTIGYATRLLLIPSERFACAILTNSLEGAAAVEEIERLILTEAFGELPPRELRPVDAELADALLGTYDCGFYGTITLVRGAAEGEMRIIANPAPADADGYLIALDSPDRLVLAPPDTLVALGPDGPLGDAVSFTREPDGTVPALRYHERIAHRVS
ncbi:serine hydrolase domain-containing protein [Peterkaempfera bronchialis]|uniref:Class A beta-lactamase-related serine hydrolase n=1 Tax=Peterkaempfera bronchialis TaxID=2126346 RepID=A0A345T4L9_9ACTN|nr:serine hydrolase domain-containing protein [Peterkaempfera bronchialis]AXI80924.1 class A beta-lactamase-related serine hydrolase [Peterkaempfera bronchialis]